MEERHSRGGHKNYEDFLLRLLSLAIQSKPNLDAAKQEDCTQFTSCTKKDYGRFSSESS